MGCDGGETFEIGRAGGMRSSVAGWAVPFFKQEQVSGAGGSQT